MSELYSRFLAVKTIYDGIERGDILAPTETRIAVYKQYESSLESVLQRIVDDQKYADTYAIRS